MEKTDGFEFSIPQFAIKFLMNMANMVWFESQTQPHVF